jgi:Bacterial TSP3 repeat
VFAAELVQRLHHAKRRKFFAVHGHAIAPREIQCGRLGAWGIHPAGIGVFTCLSAESNVTEVWRRKGEKDGRAELSNPWWNRFRTRVSAQTGSTIKRKETSMKPIQKLFIAATVTVSLCGWTPPALAQNPDTDGDYLSDSDETNIYHTDPNNPDTDGDGRTDWQEVYETTDPLNPASKATWPVVADRPIVGGSPNRMEDSGPTLTVYQENGTWYFEISDGDPALFYDLVGSESVIGPWTTYLGKLKMGQRYMLIDPSYATFFYRVYVPIDSDSDGLTDVFENLWLHTNPNDPDSDDDGLFDSQEYQGGTNPNDPDCPRDALESAINGQSPNAWFKLNDMTLDNTGIDPGGQPLVRTGNDLWDTDVFDNGNSAFRFHDPGDRLTLTQSPDPIGGGGART